MVQRRFFSFFASIYFKTLKILKKLSLFFIIFIVFTLIYLIILGFIIANFGNSENTNFDNSTNNQANNSMKNNKAKNLNINLPKNAITDCQNNIQDSAIPNSQKPNCNLLVSHFDTIIVLGAGLIDNSVSPVLAARIDHALDLYQKNVAKSIIFTGGIGQNQVISEGEASFDYAIKKLDQQNQTKIDQNKTDFNKNQIENKENLNNSGKIENLSGSNLEIKYNFFFEKSSKTTKQNLLEAKQIMKQNNLETAIIVSDSLHLFRTNQIANLLNLKVQISPTPYSRYQTLHSKSGFLLQELFFCQVFWLTGN